ncbi:MAG: hypothetical protein ACI9JY_003088 [Saprospiraceae bacterium]|jgi:hypothetical protein
MSIKKFTLCAVVCILSFYACQNKFKPVNSVAEKPKEIPLDGTDKMVKLLQEVEGKIDPMKVAYFSNHRRVDFYKTKISQAANLNEQLTGMLFLSYELLNVGKNEEAIVKLSSLLQQMEGKVSDKAIFRQVKRLLAFGVYALRRAK